jgi:hypothetical protein
MSGAHVMDIAYIMGNAYMTDIAHVKAVLTRQSHVLALLRREEDLHYEMHLKITCSAHMPAKRNRCGEPCIRRWTARPAMD